MSTNTSLRQIKLVKKAKVAIGRSKRDSESETLVTEKKDFVRRKRNSRNSSDDGVTVTYENNKLYRRESNDEVSRGGGDLRRKRVFSENRDNYAKKNGFFEGKHGLGGKSNDFDRGEKGRGLRREGMSRENDPFDRLISVKKSDLDRKSNRERLDKKDGMIKLENRKEREKNRSRESFGESAKEKKYGKKIMGEDGEENDGRRKKKKIGIRLDPNDISNKRIDDGIVTAGEAEKKEEDIEKDKKVEISMNAQFRAITPSPSILSFMEDNYLGRRRMIELRRAGYNIDLSAPLDNIPNSKSSERERIEEPVFRNKLTFFAAANVSSSFPAPDLPEIAFAGRSNVGKSSMLNALTRQWGVARTSDKPGLTQTINFFNLGPKVSLVDLPGYGFAYAKDEVKEAWEDLVKEYVLTREGLKRVCLLIDTKWGMKPRDIELIDLMEKSQTKYQIVLTKTDLVFPIDVARRAMQIEERLKAKRSAVQPVMMVSSKTGAGIRTLRTVLSKIARIAKV